MSDLMAGYIDGELSEYGVPSHSIQLLTEGASPHLIEYLDLVEPRGNHALMPDGVVESQGRPLLFVVDEGKLALSSQEQETAYQRLRHVLACRGQRAYLARLRPGQLSVVPVKVTDRKLHWKTYSAGSDEALSFFPRLTLGHYDGPGDTVRKDYVFEQMLKLLNQAAHELVDSHNIDKADVLSLVGRALFFRFLRDRRIITDQDTSSISPVASDLDACFATPQNATATCHWLDTTFNGDFLSLTGAGNSDFFNAIGRRSQDKVFDHLTAIARGYEAVGGKEYQLRLWHVFDFAHIPVGLLSQVYENFAWKWDPYASSTSVHYTPRHIASTLVEEVFDKLPNAHQCRALDPACGAGVFLVLVFRRLYRERWEATGIRPDTGVIREILERQITGFDISEAALKMAALSLYLTAIELDPDPIPPHKLRFKDLRGTVLHNFRLPSEPATGPVIGSLNEKFNIAHDGLYNIVVSNPPWTSMTEEYGILASELNRVSKDVISRREAPDLAKQYRNPDSGPDMPFLWKSSEWCEPNGRIAMALPARLLLKQEEIPCNARNILFQLIEVNGIINCSNLANTPVWPKMGQPFLLLFASNRRPAANHTLQFVTPQYDATLVQRGEMWIDSKSAIQVDVEATFKEPWLWKSLAVGTPLDVEVIRKIKRAESRSLGVYWEKELGLATSNGYKIAEDDDNRQDARALQDLPDLDTTDKFRFLVDVSKLERFSRSDLARSRIANKHADKLRVYRGPLALIKQSPGVDRRQSRALLCFDDVAFTESFYGYSAAGHPQDLLLTRYIQLFAHSDLWIYYALLTSPKFGAERRKFYKSDFDGCPIIPLKSLSSLQQNLILQLSERLLSEDLSVLNEIDEFFASLYGLNSNDLEVIRDTLSVGMPYEQSHKFATSPPSGHDLETFRQRLLELLTPFFTTIGKDLTTLSWRPHASQRLIAFSDRPETETPFAAIFVGTSSEIIGDSDKVLWHDIVRLATRNGATRIFLQVEGGLLVAILNQYRYWTPTRARLCAAEIIRFHMSNFKA